MRFFLAATVATCLALVVACKKDSRRQDKSAELKKANDYNQMEEEEEKDQKEVQGVDYDDCQRVRKGTDKEKCSNICTDQKHVLSAHAHFLRYLFQFCFNEGTSIAQYMTVRINIPDMLSETPGKLRYFRVSLTVQT